MVSSMPLKVDEDSFQRLVFYKSRVLRGVESRNPKVEKNAFIVVYIAHHLRLYFQARKVILVTNDCLKKVLQGPERTSKLILWVIELCEFNIEYVPRKAIKASMVVKVLANFTK